MKTYKQTIITIVLGLTLAAGLSYAATWTGPAQNPPLANTDAPLNAGISDQIKGGGVSFGSLISRGGAVVGGEAVVRGKIKIGDDAVSPSAGDIRWTGSDFEGYNGTQWQSFTRDTQGGGKVYNAKNQVFSSSGVFSVPEGVTTVWVSLSAGGGGGGGGMLSGKYSNVVAPGGGGGSGQAVYLKEISVPSGAKIPVTVGAGGGGGVSALFVYKKPLTQGKDGADGGNTSFGSFVSVAGGQGGKIGTIRDKYGNNPGAGGAGSPDGQPGRCYDLLYGKDYALCTTFWSDQGGGVLQYGGAGSGGSTSGAYTTFVQGPTTVSEHQSIPGELIYTYYPAQNGNDSGGGGGGIISNESYYSKTPKSYNGGNGGSGYATVYWCDAGLTPVSGNINGGLCQ